MAYQLEQNESFDEGLKRIATEETELALTQLGNTDDELIHEAIHQTRNNVKRVRALLRLIRFEFDTQEAFKEEDICFRDAGRFISDLRDAHVALETLDLLVLRYQDLNEHSLISEIQTQLQRRLQEVMDTKIGQDNVIEKALIQFTQAKKRIANLPHIPEQASLLLQGLRETYRKGQDALETARLTPETDHFHDWRKQVKYLWNQYCILNVQWPEELKPWGESLHSLSDYLGTEHDLAVFAEIFEEPEIHEFLARDGGFLIEAIQSYRKELQHNALELGAMIYADAPEGFVGKLGPYWDTANN